ncbi:MMPL family transporter [Actinomadura madurae]|uniref:MMPL family transporter n=1 Tax=Actinomadura madurae TaxID=1993 RepID=UPI003999A8D1
MLAIIVVILIGLLRSLPVPAVLVATVALNFAATLGVSALVFEHLFGFTGTDASVPLYGFVFLVALGVIPLAFLVQIAFIVSFGVLLDTLVVRSLLVPALVRDAGPRIWWPSSLSRHPDLSDPPDPPRRRVPGATPWARRRGGRPCWRSAIRRPAGAARNCR